MACLSVDKERKREKSLIISIMRKKQMYIRKHQNEFLYQAEAMSIQSRSVSKVAANRIQYGTPIYRHICQKEYEGDILQAVFRFQPTDVQQFQSWQYLDHDVCIVYKTF